MALLFLSKNSEINVSCLSFFFKAMTFETPKGTAAVILGFETPSSTNSQISPSERYDEHPRYFSRGLPTPGATSHISEESFLTKK